MSLNSEIRNIPLLGNVDMTKFQADIHDYSGFRNDNSFFFNKRKVNWWRRELAQNEFGGLRAEISGQYFNIFKNERLLGTISRDYYKLESQDVPYTLIDPNIVVNPYPAGAHNRMLFKLGTSIINLEPFSANVRKCGDFYFVWYKNTSSVLIYDSNFNYLTSLDISISNSASDIDYVDFYYASSDFDLIITNGVSLHIPARYVYVSILPNPGTTHNPDCVVYNPVTNSYVSREDLIVYSSVSGNFQDTRGAYDQFNPSGDPRNGSYGMYEIVVLNGELYINCYSNHYGGVTNISNSYLKKGKNVIKNYNWLSGDHRQIFFNGSLQNKNISSYPCSWEYRFYLYADDNTSAVTDITFTAENVYQIKNYSANCGQFYINFFNNVAQNIADRNKKLILLNGYEDSEHKLTEIDGYDSSNIWFHRDGKYYHLSIATTSNIKDVVTTFNGNYIIFNTVSYNNALFILNEKWFCSCDDWNDRLQWICKLGDETRELDFTSRINNNWQTQDSIVTVSDQLPTMKRKIPVKVSEITPFSSGDTWDGETEIYNVEKKKVDTSQWLIGDSLEGYYKAAEFITKPDDIYPYSISTSHFQLNIQYPVYFPKTVEIDTIQPIIKQGFIKINPGALGIVFYTEIDEGDIYTSPASDSERQEVPCLLDFRYIVFDSSVIAVSPTGGYTLMQNSLVGIYVFVYLLSSETNSISETDSIFIINGTEYIYKAMTERILDSSGLYVANTHLLKFLGFSSKAAYFYSIFDKCVYAFKGDNSFEKVLSLESREIVFSGYGKNNQANSIYISSINLFIVKLSDSVLLIYDNQFIILETGEVTSWDFDFSSGIFYINDFAYSLIKKNIEDNNPLEKEISFIPVSFETHFYGLPENERNMINDTVYLTVDNLADLPGGSVKIKAQIVQNQKIISLAEKVVNLQTKDFNDLAQAMIKYQPQIQEGKGFKLFIDSDFEISELKIGISAGAMNQTIKRI